MTSDWPDPTDPTWQAPPATNIPTPMIGSTLDHLEDRRQATSLEGWSEMPLPDKMKAAAATRLLAELNGANISVRRIEFSKAGLFSRGMLRVRLAVPDHCLSYATRIARDLLGRE